MAKGIRTKPCGNCKKSKVKCEYDKTLPCTRCINIGLASSCHFSIKLPSLSFPSVDPSQAGIPLGPPRNPSVIHAHSASPIYSSPGSLPKLNALSNTLPSAPSASLPRTSQPTDQVKTKQIPLYPKNIAVAAEERGGAEIDWRSTMERKLDSVDAKFNDILSVLQANQKALRNERQSSEDRLGMAENARNTSVSKRPAEATHIGSENIHPVKRRLVVATPETDLRPSKYGPNDFRDNVLTIEQAKTLFKFFDEKIAQQLFGFEIKDFSVDVIWESSPILVCAICTIASMHYPGQDISSKQEKLKNSLQELCASVLFANRPRTELEAFNTIVSLVLCSFWLSDSQMFTGLALQLAKEFNLNQPARGEPVESSLGEKERVKLWYLLFILDGQQSMTLNRQALVTSDDYTLQNSRKLLTSTEPRLAELPEQSSKVKDSDLTKTPNETNTRVCQNDRLTDLRLVSQVEYNIALSESFKGNAWDLLAPSSFGIPSRTNLELDKWMVSWTVLLAPMNNGAVWSSKSTLIYYNFAKMHINSTVIRQLQEDRGGSGILIPNWKKYRSSIDKDKVSIASAGSRSGNEALAAFSKKDRDFKNGPNRGIAKESGEDDDEDDDDDEDEDDDDDFITNHSLVTQDQALVSCNIAISAAQTVLNLVLNDPDISENLKYVPVHVHMMLYYAAILLVNPPTLVANEGPESEHYFYDIVARLKTVRSLQNKVYANLPTDRSFGDQFIRNLDSLFAERVAILMSELHASTIEVSRKAALINEISMLQFASAASSVPSSANSPSSCETSPRPEKISAWPGSHHGHP